MSEIKDFFTSLGLSPTWAVIIAILAFCLLNYDKVKLLYTDICCWIAQKIGWCKRSATKLKIEQVCSDGFKSIVQEVPELELPKININWVSEGENKVQLKDGEAIVFLKYNLDNSQNIVNITSAYVKETVLPIPKTYMSSKVRNAIDYTVIRKCLLEMPQKHIMVNNYIKESHEIITQNQAEIEKVCNIDDAGLMSRILFREYIEWGNKIFGRNTSEKYQKEAADFLDFLYNITSRGYDDNTQLQYISENIKVGVLLVAKIETFAERGEEPYVRRIKEGFAKGIRTFYLLARNEKLEIVSEVYSKLIQTGNYNLLNGPKVYKDSQGRENICYCIEVNSEGDMAKTYSLINEAMEGNHALEGVITAVYKNGVSCLINNVEVKIPRDKITDIEDLKLHYYFKVGTTIEIIPKEIDKHGIVKGSIIETNSNPQTMVNNKFTVGSEVIAIVDEAYDDYIKLRVKDSEVNAIAFRKNLTYSHYTFLHHKFPVGAEFLFTIIDIDYISNKLYLQLTNLEDPWSKLNVVVGQTIICEIFQKKDNCIITEINEGIRAILPFTETSWFASDFSLAKNFKNNDKLECRIKCINKDERIIILTTKTQESPYADLYNDLKESQYIVDAQFVSSDSNGIICTIKDKYRVFIPQSETHIGSNYYKIKRKDSLKIEIKGISEDKRSFIGTLKPFIVHPMQWFKDNYKEGMALSHLSIKSVNPKSVLYDITYNKGQKLLGLLPISEVTNLCYIASIEELFKNRVSFPLIIKEIDMEQCVVKLSLKKLLENNKGRADSLNFMNSYSAIVVGSDASKHTVLIIENVWIEGVLTEAYNGNMGDRITVRAVSTREIPEFVID